MPFSECLECLPARAAAYRLERIRGGAHELKAVDAVGVHLAREAGEVEADDDDKVC